ncbi:MAG TPA: hypothetical protein VG944_24350 [Fimbriimonas sp.]|nr:hypothetical protein [Fimbriimonas sp.]
MKLLELLTEWGATKKLVGCSTPRRNASYYWGYPENVTDKAFTLQKVSPFGEPEPPTRFLISRIGSFEDEPIYAGRLARLTGFTATLPDKKEFDSREGAVRRILSQACASGEVVSVRLLGEEDPETVRVLSYSAEWVEMQLYDNLMRPRGPVLYRQALIASARWRSDYEEASAYLSDVPQLRSGVLDVKSRLEFWKEVGKPFGFSPWSDGCSTVWGLLTRVSRQSFTVSPISSIGAIEDLESFWIRQVGYFDTADIYAERLTRLRGFRPTLPETYRMNGRSEAISEALEHSIRTGEPIRVKMRGDSASASACVRWIDEGWVGLQEYDDLMLPWRFAVYPLTMIGAVLWQSAAVEADAYLLALIR